MSKHIRGEWYAVKDMDKFTGRWHIFSHYQQEKETTKICEVRGDEAEANARLIAESPIQHKLLNYALAYIRNPEGINGEELASRIEKSIAKATPEQSSGDRSQREQTGESE